MGNESLNEKDIKFITNSKINQKFRLIIGIVFILISFPATNYCISSMYKQFTSDMNSGSARLNTLLKEGTVEELKKEILRTRDIMLDFGQESPIKFGNLILGSFFVFGAWPITLWVNARKHLRIIDKLKSE